MESGVVMGMETAKETGCKEKRSPQIMTKGSCSSLNNVDVCALFQLQLHSIFSNLSFFWTIYVVESQGMQNVAIILDFPMNSPGKHSFSCDNKPK